MHRIREGDAITMTLPMSTARTLVWLPDVHAHIELRTRHLYAGRSTARVTQTLQDAIKALQILQRLPESRAMDNSRQVAACLLSDVIESQISRGGRPEVTKPTDKLSSKNLAVERKFAGSRAVAFSGRATCGSKSVSQVRISLAPPACPRSSVLWRPRWQFGPVGVAVSNLSSGLPPGRIGPLFSERPVSLRTSGLHPDSTVLGIRSFRATY